MDKLAIIRLKRQGLSNRKISKMLNIDPKIIATFWKEYEDSLKKLENKKNVK